MKESLFSIEILRKCKEIEPVLEKDHKKYLFLFNEILGFEIDEETVKLYQTAFLVLFFEHLVGITFKMRPHVEEFFEKYSHKEEQKEELRLPDKIFTRSIELPETYSIIWNWEFDLFDNGPKHHRIHFFFKEWEINNVQVSVHESITSDSKVEFPDIIEN